MRSWCLPLSLVVMCGPLCGALSCGHAEAPGRDTPPPGVARPSPALDDTEPPEGRLTEDRVTDRCLNDGGDPLDEPSLAALRAVWLQLSRGEAPSSLAHLRAWGAGPCTPVHWRPVTPAFAWRGEGVDVDDAGCPRTRTLFMPEVGSVTFELRTRALAVAEAGGDEIVHELDDRRRVVTRRRPDATAVELVTRGEGDTSERRALAARPDGNGATRKIDAQRVVIDGDVVDVRTGKRLHVPSAGIFVPSPKAPWGVSLVGGLDSSGQPWRAFVTDGRGREIARLQGAPAAVVAMPLGREGHEEGVALASFDDATRRLSLTVVVDGKVEEKSAVIAAGPLAEGGQSRWLRGVGNKDAVALGLAHSLVVWPRGAPVPVVFSGFDPPTSPRGAEAQFVLDGGRIVVATSDRRTVVLDVSTREVVAEGYAARFTRDAAYVEDPGAVAAKRAVIIAADGSVRRGPLGTALVGRFSLPQWIDVVDPWLECDARALSALPSLVSYPMGGRVRTTLRGSERVEVRMRGDAYAPASVLHLDTPPLTAIGVDGQPTPPRAP